MNKIRKNKLFHPFLFLLSIIYRLIIDIRNFFYDKGILQSKSYPIPVISIGNITTGGTGKTPFTLFLFQQLMNDYKKIAVISRGYGRKSKGLKIVSDGQGNITSAEIGGDEPVLMAKKFKHVVVIDSEDRREGIQKAIDQFGVDLILLDDAFQHRKVKRNCDIVLINANQPLSGEKILPLGNLREDIRHLRRADLVIYTKGEKKIEHKEDGYILNQFDSSSFHSFFNIKTLTNRSLESVTELKDLLNNRVLAFCGIADAEYFKNSLLNKGLNVVHFISFKDHQSYRNEQIKRIENAAIQNNCHTILTTEKDMVKLNDNDLKDFNVFAISLEIIVLEQEKFIKKVKQCIDSKS